MRWVDVSTPRDALLGVATSAEQGQIYFDSIRLKAFTMRSMALSYDAINFVYTNPPQLIAADQRLKETLAVGDGSMPPSQFMRDYLIEYLVISADRAAPLDRVVYKNHTYAVLAR
jgi:hypothetical protein